MRYSDGGFSKPVTLTYRRENMESEGNTHLHIAVFQRRIDVVENLLTHETSLINKKNNEGNTALILSVMRYNWRIADCLLSHGANPDIQNNEGKTALHVCAEKNALQMVKVLVSNGADLHIKDNNGRLAVNLTGYSAVKEYLEEQRVEQRLHREIAFAMGYHDRLGAGSSMKDLPLDIFHKINELTTRNGRETSVFDHTNRQRDSGL